MMVMFATATTASLKKTNDVVIMLKNHERALHVNAGGKVTATDISLAQFFSMESVGDIFSDTFKIALYAKEVGRFLCFRRGKLVGMKNLTRDCHFIESLDHGYFLYANAYNPLWRVGFTKGLKPVGPRHWKRPQALKRACFLFVKINAEHFDRSRFTTTTTNAPSIAAAVPMREGHKLHDSKASIIDSNSNNSKRTKSANNGKRQLLINSENVNATGGRTREWSEREAMEQRHRKRKHHAKLAGASGTGASSGLLQPKNLVRHHHDQGNGEGRRRQHQREDKERKLRLQNQRRQKQEEDEEGKADSESRTNATNSATPSLAATTLAATASLAPSALNIVAMLAAGRRKRGRRKKQVDTSVTNAASNSGHHQAMDLQLVAQSPIQAQSQYDRVQLDNTKSHGPNVHKLRHHHEHNYHQKQQATIAPVHANSPSTKEVLKVQQQNQKYSNFNRDRQLKRNSRSRSSRSSSSINSNNLSHNFNLRFNDNVNNINLISNSNNNNNNNNINAIPALPKNYLSENNFNHEYLMQPTTRSSTDFNTKQQQFSHSLHSTSKKQQQQQQQLHIHRTDHSHTSHELKKLPSKLFQQKVTNDTSDHVDNDNYNDSDDDVVDSHTNNKNPHRLLVNNSHLSDNNLQQEQSVNRFKLIYLDRIRSHNCNFKFNTNNNNCMNKTQTQQQVQHYKNTENISPISSTTTKTANENQLIANIALKASSSSSIKNSTNNSSSRSIFKTSTTSTRYYNHNNKRRKRSLTNNYNNDYAFEESRENNSNNNNAKVSSTASSRSSTSSHSSNDTNIYVLQHLKDNKVNIFKNSKQDYLNILMPSTTANHNSKMWPMPGQHKILKQQPKQIIKLINNPNKTNFNDTDTDNDNANDKKGEQFEGIQNKYEKILVQYRSVFNCLENGEKTFNC